MVLSNSLPAPLGRVVFWLSMAALTLITFAALSTLTEPVLAYGRPYQHHSPGTDGNDTSLVLAEFALGKVLEDAAPVFGDYVDVQSNTSNWLVKDFIMRYWLSDGKSG